MRLDAATFDRMFDKVPGFGKAIAKELSQRLSEASAQMALPLYDKDVGTISNEVRALIPLELVQRHRVLPLEIKGNQLLIGLVDDPTSQTINAIKTHLPSMELQQVRVTAQFFNTFMGQTGGLENTLPKTKTEVKPVKSNPVLDKLLQRMVSEGASDLHLSGAKPRWRVDGDILTLEDGHLLGEEEVYTLFKPIMDQRNIDEFDAINDTDLPTPLKVLPAFDVTCFEIDGALARFLDRSQVRS